MEKRANSSVGLFVTVPGTLTKKAYEQACQRLVNDRKLAIPGFRKGQKVPEQVLLNAVGGPGVIINEALDVLCEDALKTAIDEADIKAVGQVGGFGSVVGGIWFGGVGLCGPCPCTHHIGQPIDRLVE